MKDQSPDRMIRDTLSNPKYAVSFFKGTLPAPVLNRIDITSISHENTT
ncbi:MAG: Rpn family recombination-promoting nuclease/putative transposase, partial [Leptonema sp. (in: Bacteria)]|nr:Rpn family recombination-promoting nuclease/putative transposase [Leptonema sp. (in: bacteria)]